MPGEAPSELPQFYGGKTSDGQIVKRPRVEGEASALGNIASPSPVYRPGEQPISPGPGVVESGAVNGARGELRHQSSASDSNGRGAAGDYGFRRSSSTRRPSGIKEGVHWDERDYDTSYRQDRSHADERTNGRRKSIKNYEDPFLERTRSKGYPAGRHRPSNARLRQDDEETVNGFGGSDFHLGERRFSFKDLSKEERAEVMRLPWLKWMNCDVKNHLVATVGEFIGTTMFLFFAFAGTSIANSTVTDPSVINATVIFYVSVIFGFSLMVNVWVFFRISGGLFNPAVTLGMVLVGAIPPLRAVYLVAAQLAGGIAASGLVIGLFPVGLNVHTSLRGGATLLQGVLIEALLTAELVFTIFMLAKEKHKATYLAPVGIGLALFIAQLVSVYYTGGSLNPARSFGPAVATGTFKSDHWVYWVGPFVGALIAVFFYKFIQMLEYEMANPGQDGDPHNDPTQSEEKLAEILQKRRGGSSSAASQRPLMRSR